MELHPASQREQRRERPFRKDVPPLSFRLTEEQRDALLEVCRKQNVPVGVLLRELVVAALREGRIAC